MRKGLKMKKALYKILIALIVILMLLEFVFNVNRSNAETKNATIGPDFINAVANATGGVVSIIYWPKRIELIGIAFIIDKTFYNLAASDDPDLGGYLNLDYLRKKLYMRLWIKIMNKCFFPILLWLMQV